MRTRRDMLGKLRRPYGLVNTQEELVRDVRALERSPREGDTTQIVYATVGAGSGSGGGGGGASAHGDIDTTGMRQTIWVAGFRPTTTAGCESPRQYEFGTNDVDELVCAFDAATTEYAWAQLAMPDNWDAGDLTARLFWTPRTDGTNDMTSGTVRWGVALLAFGNSDALDQAWPGGDEVNDAFDLDSDLHITDEITGITPGGSPAAGDLLKIRVYRDIADAADTGNGDAWLMGVKLEYGITALSA